MQVGGDKQPVDVDYLFDHFEEFCAVEFRNNQEKLKQPSVVKNLNTLFEKVASTPSQPNQGIQKTRSKSRSKPKHKVVKGSLDKSKKRDKSEKNGSVKKKLKLNLKEVFSADPSLKQPKGAFDSTKSAGLAYSTKSTLMQFIRKKTETLNCSQVQYQQAKKSSSVSKSKNKGGKSALKQTCVKLNNLFKEKDILTQKVVTKNWSKPTLAPMDLAPPTGSTRINTVTSRNDSNKRSSSFLDTELKPKNQSCRNLRTDSFMASANINSILNSSKNLHYKLLRGKEEVKPSQPVVTALDRKSQVKLQSQATVTKEARPAKDKESAGRKQSATKSKYYIPAHIGCKAPQSGQHNSFAHSEDFSQGGGGRSNYLHRVLFPKLIGKVLNEESRVDLPNRKSKGGQGPKLV